MYKKAFQRFWYSFPVQLLLLHLRRHQFMLLPFLLFILIATRNFGVHYGVDSLLLDPEYLGRVTWLSYFIIGFSYGGFVLTWQMTSYILHSHRFPFLVTFEKPFLRYILNNSVMPLLFLLIYFISLFLFKSDFTDEPVTMTLLHVLAFLAGGTIMMLIPFAKYFNHHKTEAELSRDSLRRNKAIRRYRNEENLLYRGHIRVDSLLLHPFKLRPVRDVSHYREEALQNIFRKHHLNALKFLLIALGFLLTLSVCMDYPAFRIPAGASLILLFTILISPVGALSYWLKTWSTPALIGALLLFNFISRGGLFVHRNSAFGISYQHTVPYNLRSLENASSESRFLSDRANALRILEQWKHKVNPANDTVHKPYIVFLNCSGGGLRSAEWSFYCMQQLDSLTHFNFFNHVHLISGASGGMMGTAYYRELFDRMQKKEGVNPLSRDYLQNVSKDLLNAVSFSIVVNDLFFPWQHFHISGKTYTKDRGYLFERQWNENTGHVMEKTVGDYRDDEQSARIPMMIISPVITDDARRFNISPFPIAFMNAPPDKYSSANRFDVDAVDLMNFFGDNDGASLSFTSALRMNATFPYIMPNVYLPTSPAIQVMDAGLRDDYGEESTARFIETFRDWIDKNTSGAILLQLRSFNKNMAPEVSRHESFFSKLLAPINSIYVEWDDFENFQEDQQLCLLDKCLKVPLHVLSFEYSPQSKKGMASMSWHLTDKEKQDVQYAFQNIHNQLELQRLLALLREDGK